MDGLAPNSTDAHMWTSAILQIVTARKKLKDFGWPYILLMVHKWRPKILSKKIHQLSSSAIHLTVVPLWSTQGKNTFCHVRGGINQKQRSVKIVVLKWLSQTLFSGAQFEHALTFYILIKFSSYIISIHSCIWQGFFGLYQTGKCHPDQSVLHWYYAYNKTVAWC